jgi:putative heme-binding domain-containing protein
MTPRERLRLVAFVKSFQYKPRPARGNVAAGSQLYAQMGCSSCHRTALEGRVTGVDLTRVGAIRSSEHLLESLVDPAVDVPDGYRLIRVVTIDNRVISGARHYEDTFSIQLYDDQDRLQSFWKDEVKVFESLVGQSPMPSYAGTLSDSQLHDLVAYLSSLR